MTNTDTVEYRVERLRSRLAREDVSELGVRVEVRGAGLLLSGSVSDQDTRAAVLRIAAEELAGLHWQEDLTVNHAEPPLHAEELS
ncbi:BON domain-containing protein [Streptomyces sp. NPDC001717]|uniref:BON domain-containing protein n=1 Tax=Streptomyces sp. NPDC001717 TaxID=3364604 RepID=UPI0036C2EFD5